MLQGPRQILIMNMFNIQSWLTLCSIIATNTISWTLVCEVEAAAPKATPSAKFGDKETEDAIKDSSTGVSAWVSKPGRAGLGSGEVTQPL